jgi:hypothetical protein
MEKKRTDTMNIDKLIDSYNHSFVSIYEYFGYDEDGWMGIFPIDDKRKYFWRINNEKLKYSWGKDSFHELYEDNCDFDIIIYDLKFKVENYTMVAVRGLGGEKSFVILDNNKELK